MMYFGKFFLVSELQFLSSPSLLCLFIYLSDSIYFYRFTSLRETLTLGIFIKSCPFVMLQTPIAFIFINVMWNE